MIMMNENGFAVINEELGPKSNVFLVRYVGERSCWPIQSPNKGRKNKAKG